MSGPQPGQRKRVGKGPFRGNAGKRTYQTIDLGTGGGINLIQKATRYPTRRYAAVDQSYTLQRSGKFYRSALQKKGIATYGEVLKTLREMRERGVRTRHVNMDMPYPWSRGHGKKGIQAFDEILDILPRILLPNGHFFITSEEKATLDSMRAMAHAKGYATAFLTPLTHEKDKQRTETMRYFMEDPRFPIYRLRITLGLKKAIPDKTKRKTWPE